ncbi:unnamed protein product [Prorocentrum cordatum]|uniref:Uncharacterized protein n=1 Tax=Prorocentrum cordatum TaxID=2364126 RepID=A0ABN9S717_9DINO|nr:unnamed protein product [Polarella glacialis]
MALQLLGSRAPLTKEPWRAPKEEEEEEEENRSAPRSSWEAFPPGCTAGPSAGRSGERNAPWGRPSTDTPNIRAEASERPRSCQRCAFGCRGRVGGGARRGAAAAGQAWHALRAASADLEEAPHLSPGPVQAQQEEEEEREEEEAQQLAQEAAGQRG